MKARHKRDAALARARDYAKAGRYELALIWAKSAADYMPLTEMQLWLLRQCVGAWKFDEMGFEHLPQVKNVLTAHGYRP